MNVIIIEYDMKIQCGYTLYDSINSRLYCIFLTAIILKEIKRTVQNYEGSKFAFRYFYPFIRRLMMDQT